MNNERISRTGWKGIVGVIVALLALLSYQRWSASATISAANRIKQAWNNVRLSDEYRFAADVVIKTIPLATSGNIGRFSKTQSLFLEGRNDLDNDSLELALWGGGVNVANRAAAYQVRVRDGRIETRAGSEAWRSDDNSAIAFAPDGDFLAYLDMAQNVALAADRTPASDDPACAALDCAELAVYTFDLNSRAYAERLRSLSEQQMIRSGLLAPGASAQLPLHLANVTGSGELWVDGRGLPVRQRVTLAIPAAAGADYRTETQMDIRFSDYQGSGGQLAAIPWLRPLAGRLSGMDLPQPSELAANLGLTGMILAGAVVVMRPGRRTRLVTTIVALIAILVTPTLQADAATSAATRYRVVQAAQAQADETQTLQQQLQDAQNALRAAGPYAPPPAALDAQAAATSPQDATASTTLSTSLDTDGDGLTDELEDLVGTNPYATDGDLDTVSDFDEITGFLVGSQRWYGNPMAPDSNFDGVIDGVEWNATAPDTDGDGTPNLYDFDDDQDGVPDGVDVSRTSASKDDSGQPVVFTKSSPLVFKLDGLQANSFAYVTLQLRPTNPDHLWYAYNVLNWPRDEKGNMQDWDQRSFFDHCQATGGSDCKMTPDDNGDLKFVPMLEISVADLGSLPRRSNGSVDEELLARYSMSLQPAGDGSYLIYVPLNLVEEPETGSKVAFQAQLLFQAGASWTPQQMRLVWAVHVLQEQYDSADAYTAARNNGTAAANNAVTILHTYHEDFQLTGLNVREDRGVKMAVVYEDPATDTALNDDDALIHLANGLESVYFDNRDCDLVDNDGACVGDGQRDITIPVIQQRWDRNSNAGTTTGQRWGIEQNRLRVELHDYRHEDEATILAGSQVAPRILNDRFQATAARMPGLLFVREAGFRAVNLTGRAANGPITWTGASLNVNLAQEALVTMANVAYAAYEREDGGWKEVTPYELVEELEDRYPTGPAQGDNTVVISDDDKFFTAVEIVQLQQGHSAVVGIQNGQSGLSGALTANGKLGGFSPYPITDDQMRHVYQQGLNAVGVRLAMIVRGYVSGQLKVPAFTSVERGLAVLKLARARVGDELSTVRQRITWDTGIRWDPNRFNPTSGKLGDYVQGTTSYSLIEQHRKLQKQLEGLDIARSNLEVKLKAQGLLQFEANDLVARSQQVRRYGLMFGGATLAGAAISLVLSNLKGTQTAGEVGMALVSAVSSVQTAVETYTDLALKVKVAALNLPPGTVARLPAMAAYSFANSAAKAGAVGAVIGGAVSWVLFFAAWGKGGLSTDSIAFYTLLAGAIAATIQVVVTFIIGLTVVGAVILAVFAVFDLFALIICKAGVKKACELGIMAAITQVITEWIYTGEVMIETQDKNNPIVNIDDMTLRLTDPERGLAVGNGVSFEASITSAIRHAVPKPSVVWNYSEFYTPEDLLSTTVRYSLTKQESKLQTQLNQSRWTGAYTYAYVESDVPAPGVGWLVPLARSKWLYQTNNVNLPNTITSPVYNFTEARINQAFPLYLNVGMTLPRYDCWFSVCKHKTVESATSENFSDKFVLDILPATLSDFYWWNQLGVQIDRDGDGLVIGVDPDDTKWDIDGDGLSDAAEGKAGSNRQAPDTDGDGLSDLQEARLNTSSTSTDSDGDGITDREEIEGYALTFNGMAVHVTSNPVTRDTDDDGMSDGAERRLNGIDPARYPFHPRVFNDGPAQIYTTLDDYDHVLAPGATTVVTTTVLNGTAVENALLASGTFSATLPAELGGAAQTRSFTLLPTTRADIVLAGTAAAGERYVTVDNRAAADLIPIGTTPTGPPDDVILQSPAPVVIDSDLPDEPALTLGAFVQPGRTAIIGGTASDPTSYIGQVDVSVADGPFNPATGDRLWSFPVEIPNTPTGIVPITVRASDAVSNTRAAAYSLTIDGVAPDLAVGLNPGDLRRVRRDAGGAWTLRVSGSFTDTLSGLGPLTLQVDGNSNVVVPEDAIEPSGAWTFDYPFDDPAVNASGSPTGAYTLTVTARDTALPDGNLTTRVIPFIIDMTPPQVELLSHENERLLTDGTVITGTVSDTHSAVAAVEYAFVDAGTVLATEKTLLKLPLNDLPETVVFANSASVPTRIYCLDESCPTSGADGADGTAAAFGGDDLLRTFEPLDLPESGLTTSLWFKTTCADCGLFSAVQGTYPAVTQYDRDLFLAGGKVCSSILVGGPRELRCTESGSYADGQWHQAVHSLGAGGNALYVDGELAVSSPTTASTFTAQDGVLVGRSPAAGVPLLTGALDEVVIYDGALDPAAVAALYRQWQPATLAGGQWSFTVPEGIEGVYQIDMRGIDSLGNRTESRGDWPQFRGPVDTKFPGFDLSVEYSGSGAAAQTTFSSRVTDANLTTDDYAFVCPLGPEQLRYVTNPTQLAFAGPDDQLTGIEALCVQPGFQSSQVSARACDAFGHCAAGTPPQTVAYIGTQRNTLNPYGTLPNGIERTVLSDPQGRIQVIERPGQIITDIAVDETRGKLYWGELREGDYAQPGQVLRANLDGSGIETLVTGLTVYAPEALQIALDPAGNKLYWTKGHQLWWANLDGTLPEVIYTIDGAVVGVSRIGDVAVDGVNGRLYFGESRRHGTLADYEAAQAGNVTYIPWHGRKDTLIVTTNLNGTSPEFFAGVGPGCTYANFYDNQGTGTGLGLKPTICLSSGTDGFDVESLTVAGGTVYWTAISADGASSAAFGKTPGGSAFTVAPLDVTAGNSQGLRVTPLPHLYVAAGSAGVFAMLPGSVVRGERDGEFTVFGRFDEPEPQVAGLFTRKSSTLTALSVVRMPQSVQTKADLFASVTSPDLVLVNGGTGRYEMRLGNNSGLPAANTTLTLTLPSGGSFAGATGVCAAAGAAVTCDLGRLQPFVRQTLTISFTIATTDVRTLTTAVEIGTPLPDANPADNTAGHAGITAAPTLADLPGIPYIYSANLTEMWRVPLVGAAVHEYVGMDNGGIGGKVIATDTARGKLIINNDLGFVVTVNPDGTGYTVIANANPGGMPVHDDRLSVAVDETTGHLFWTEITSLYLSVIKRANLDGSGVQTVVPQVLNQRGLAIDPLRRKLLWVASDSSERQDLIFRSNLDGTEIEVAYAAPVGRQIRYPAIDPYSQKLYWLDASYDGGSLFWADSDGGRVAVLHSYLGSGRGASWSGRCRTRSTSARTRRWCAPNWTARPGRSWWGTTASVTRASATWTPPSSRTRSSTRRSPTWCWPTADRSHPRPAAPWTGTNRTTRRARPPRSAPARSPRRCAAPPARPQARTGTTTE